MHCLAGPSVRTLCSAVAPHSTVTEAHKRHQPLTPRFVQPGVVRPPYTSPRRASDSPGSISEASRIAGDGFGTKACRNKWIALPQYDKHMMWLVSPLPPTSNFITLTEYPTTNQTSPIHRGCLMFEPATSTETCCMPVTSGSLALRHS